MAKRILTCEEKVVRLNKHNRLLIIGGIASSVVVGIVMFHAASISLTGVGGGARISESDAIAMIKHYRSNHPLGGTTSYLVNKATLDELTTQATGGDPQATHLHFFFGSSGGFWGIGAKKTLIITGAKNIQTDAKPSFINTWITDATAPLPGRFEIEHVFPVENGICTELDPDGEETTRTFPIENYPDNLPH